MKKILLSALFSSLFAVTSLGFTALAYEPSEFSVETPPEILSETETPAYNLPKMESQLVDEVHIVAYDGDADLNAICACIMFGFGSVCGLLAGSEVVRKWAF